MIAQYGDACGVRSLDGVVVVGDPIVGKHKPTSHKQSKHGDAGPESNLEGAKPRRVYIRVPDDWRNQAITLIEDWRPGSMSEMAIYRQPRGDQPYRKCLRCDQAMF